MFTALLLQVAVWADVLIALFLDRYMQRRLAVDAASATLGLLDATLDTRPLVDFLAPGGPPSAVCDLVAAFGIACDPCADGEPTCLPIRIEDAPGALAADALGVVTRADVDADPACP